MLERRSAIQLLCGLAAALAIGLHSSLACAQTRPDAATSVTGTWYLALDAEPFGLPPGTSLPGLAQFHSDGTLQLLDAGDLGAAPFPTRDTAQLGNWVREQGAIRTATLFLQVDDTSGQTTGWNQVQMRLSSPRGSVMHGVVNVSFLACDAAAPFALFFCPDPVAQDQDFLLLPPENIPVTLRRLPVP